MILRDYQQEAVQAVEDTFSTGLANSALIVLPTGVGKTVIAVELAQKEPNRTLMVCPMRELIQQSANKFRDVTGQLPAIEQASNWSDESWFRNKYIVASKQTLCLRRKDAPARYERFSDVGLVIVDEAHLAITEPQLAMLDYFKSQGAKIVGVTATPNRHDKLSMENAFASCPYSMSLAQGIDLGWLCGPLTSAIQVRSMDLSGVSTSGGDFTQHELNAVLEQERVELEMADVIAKESGVLKTAVYCSSVAQAQKLSEILRMRYGLKADFVCSDKKLCSDERRDEILWSFKNDPDGIQIVTNCGVLTTGFDFPELEHIVMARPTKSLSLFTQILGRGTRPLPGIVDFQHSTPELRKAAILNSWKPKFKLTDLVDISSKHRVCSVIDALTGDMLDPLRDRLVKELVDVGTVDVLEQLEKLRRKVEREAKQKQIEEEQEAQKQREMYEAIRRRVIKGEVDYEATAVNLLEGQGGVALKKAKTGPVMLFGKYKNHPVGVVPTDYLKWFSMNIQVKPWFKSVIEKELKIRAAFNYPGA